MTPDERERISTTIGELWPRQPMGAAETRLLFEQLGNRSLQVVLAAIRAHKIKSDYKPQIGGILAECQAYAAERARDHLTPSERERAEWCDYWNRRLKEIERAFEAVPEDDRLEFAKMVRERVTPEVWAWLMGVKDRARARLKRKDGPGAGTRPADALEAAEASEGRDALIAREPWRARVWLAHLERHLVNGEAIPPRPAQWKNYGA